MPKMGESVMEGKVLCWLKKPGDTVALDEALLEVATDKVDTEIPAPAPGILEKIVVPEGETAAVGAVIAVLKTTTANTQASNTTAEIQASNTTAEIQASNTIAENTEAETQTSNTTAETPTANATQASNTVAENTAADTPNKNSSSANTPFYSPLVRSMAKKEGIPQTALAQIIGTGLQGRVTKKDLLDYLSTRNSTTPISTTPISTSPAKSSDSYIQEMTRTRQIIAKRMVTSKQTAAHVTSFVEADITELYQWWASRKVSFFEQYNIPLTLTSFFIVAIARAIAKFPAVNVSVQGSQILQHRSINIGMAVALPSDDLIVPIIHKANELSWVGVAKKVNDLARRARSNQLTIDDLSGGTYTMSNLGAFGNLMGTPIILQPQSGILAIGIARKMPAVISTPQGDAIAIRRQLILSHSYDHRVIDGALGGKFAKYVADQLEQLPESLR